MKKITVILLLAISYSSFAQKITDLPPATGTVTGSYVPIVQNGVTVKMLLDSITILAQRYSDSINLLVNNQFAQLVFPVPDLQHVAAMGAVSYNPITVSSNATGLSTVINSDYIYFQKGFQRGGRTYGVRLLAAGTSGDIVIPQSRSISGVSTLPISVNSILAGTDGDIPLAVPDSIRLNGQAVEFRKSGVFVPQFNLDIGWGSKGNLGINSDSNFLGTLDDHDLVFRRNNLPAGRIGNTNTSLGRASNQNNSGNYNTTIGLGAGYGLTTGSNNTALGGALANTSTGSNNVSIGSQSLAGNLSGSNNVAIGVSTLGYGITGSNNIALGNDAGVYSGEGNNQLFVSAYDHLDAIREKTGSILYGQMDINTANQVLTVNGTLNVNNGNGIKSSATISTAGYTVATLPAGTVGMTAYVTDGASVTYLGAVTGGGTTFAPVFRNATGWVYH